MHRAFKASNQHRVRHQSGYTEWFEGGVLQLAKMRVYLMALSLFVNGCYVLAGIGVLAVLAVVLF